MKHSHHRRFALCKVGPGGWNCACCAPPRGKRKEIFRRAKREDNLEAMKIEMSDVNSKD